MAKIDCRDLTTTLSTIRCLREGHLSRFQAVEFSMNSGYTNLLNVEPPRYKYKLIYDKPNMHIYQAHLIYMHI